LLEPHITTLHDLTVKISCFAEVIKQKGLENVTVDDLVAEITPMGRGETYRLYL